MVEILGVDSASCIVVIEEKVPRSDNPIRYGLILDLAKLNKDILRFL